MKLLPSTTYVNKKFNIDENSSPKNEMKKMNLLLPYMKSWAHRCCTADGIRMWGCVVQSHSNARQSWGSSAQLRSSSISRVACDQSLVDGCTLNHNKFIDFPAANLMLRHPILAASPLKKTSMLVSPEHYSFLFFHRILCVPIHPGYS